MRLYQFKELRFSSLISFKLNKSSLGPNIGSCELASKPSLCMCWKDCKHIFAIMFLEADQVWLGLHIIVMIMSTDFSQKNTCNRYLESFKILFGT